MLKRLIAAILCVCLTVMSLGAFAVTYRELKEGSRDTADSWNVYSLQIRLIELGLMTGSADGVYGKGTANAVKAFQEANGLEVTGIADVATQEKIFYNPADYGEESTAVEATVAPTVDPHAAMTMNDTDKYIIQGYLYRWGFTEDAPDGIFGNGTRDALKRFMTYSLEDMEAYQAEIKANATPAPTPTPEPGFMGEIDDEMIEVEPPIVADGVMTNQWFDYMQNRFDYHTAYVKKGDEGKDVIRMQRRLFALKYIPAGVDGGFGEHTEVGLKYFQRLNGLEESGVMDRATQDIIFSDSAIESDKYVTKYKANVSVKDQRVYIYEWTGSDYTKKVQTFKCSTGTTQNPTVLGTFQAAGRNGEWYYMADSYVWVRYAFVITGGYYFHSVLYKEKGDRWPTESSVRNLGKRASHGCIRLAVDDAKWIYMNCSNGMTVYIYDN